jgi:LacI family transcriptional regulator
LATIRDVAERSGVSRSTVSRFISGRGYVSPEARRRIETAIAELAFVPNAMARGLKTRRSSLVALLVPEIVNSFYTTILRGVEDVANRHGLQVIVGNTDESVAKEGAYVELMVASRVDGVIVAPASASPRTLAPLLQKNVPTVLIDRAVAGFDADIVKGDNVGGMADLARHLLALGHRRIALINGNLDTAVAREREEGFRIALADAEESVDERLVSSGAWFIDDAERRTSALLDSGRRFTAILAANNFMAIGALRALRRRGCRVPDEVALACFDDVEQAADIDPFLTVMAQPAYRMGTIAMDLLLERMDGQRHEPRREVVLSSQLVIRRSSGPPRDADPGPIGARKEAAGTEAAKVNGSDARTNRRVAAAASKLAATSRGDDR